jgi:hypothetical protein
VSFKSETFYRAECDAPNCDRIFPDGEEDNGWMPLDDVKTYMVEERGLFDEGWTIAADNSTFCWHHAPGNVECIPCRGGGYVRVPVGIANWSICKMCGGRGYLTSTAVDS